MELIKKIKQAETQAQEITEKAKAEAAEKAQEARNARLAATAEAEKARKKAVEAAVESARAEGLAEVEGLKQQADKQRQELHDKATAKVEAAISKVMDYLRG
jgi:vacuolar-type H+-ATPase subunit H